MKNELVNSSNSSTMENLRRKYFNDKMQEVKQFELKLKDDFKNEKTIYKDRKNQLKAEFQEFYENEVEKHSNNLEKDFHIQIQNTLNNVETIEKTEMMNELYILQDKLKKEKISLDETKENTGMKLTCLMNEKTEIIGEIEFFSRLLESSNKTIDLTDNELSEGKYLLEDKFNIEIRNIDRKYENLELLMNYEEECKHNKEIEMIQKTVNTNIENQEKTFKSFFGKILDDYQKALDEDYQIQAKILAKEADERVLREYHLKASDFEQDYYNGKLILNYRNKYLQREH